MSGVDKAANSKPIPASNYDRRVTPLGIWQEIPSPAIARYLAAMQWHFVVLDMQHGPMSYETAYQCVHILRAAGCEPWIRTRIGSASDVQRSLDIGAQSIVAPMVNSAIEASQIASAAKYPPLGERSVGGDFAVHQAGDYPERANRETCLFVQIEHIDAVHAIDEIMATPGVDGCFVGPTDLALSMGLQRGDFLDNIQHREAIQLVLETTHANGKLACCNSYSLEDAKQRFEEGWDRVTFRSEVDLFMGAGRQLRSDLQNLAAAQASAVETGT